MVTSFRRQDLIDNRCKNYVGTLGTSVFSKLLSAFKADLILSIGSRLSDMSTNSFKLFNKSSEKTKLIQIYPNFKEIEKVFNAELYIETDINYFANKIFKFDWFNSEKWEIG